MSQRIAKELFARPDRPPEDGFLSWFSVHLLCLMVLLYMPVQWVIGRHPGSTSIFSSQHHDLKSQFLEATAALRQHIVFACAQGGIHDVFLADGDVMSPYVVNEAAQTHGCELHRETVVTPVQPERELDCSAVIVDENLPSAWNPVRNGGELGSLDGKVVTVNAWQSTGREFAFRLLQGRGCVQDAALVKDTR